MNLTAIKDAIMVLVNAAKTAVVAVKSVFKKKKKEETPAAK